MKFLISFISFVFAISITHIYLIHYSNLLKRSAFDRKLVTNKTLFRLPKNETLLKVKKRLKIADNNTDDKKPKPSEAANSSKVNCQPHIVFSTFKCPKCDSLRQKIEDNTLHTWSNLEKVTFEVISNATTNKHGVPILGDMYTTMFDKCPDAKTYTYVNGDIMVTESFVETIEAVLNDFPSQDFLIVGKRTNVDWSEEHDAKHANFSFNAHFKKGSLFRSDAQDYFIVTKNAIDWKNIPPFVIGRPGFDNWLVDHVYHSSKVALVDATKTILAIHQTDADENFAHGGKMVKSSNDREYNRRIGKGQWDHGLISYAGYKTDRIDGRIVVKNVNANKQPEEWRVVVTVSSGFIDMFENWFYYFQRLRIGNVTLIAEDQAVSEKYRDRMGVNVLDGIFVKAGKAHDYESSGYLQMVSKRAGYLLKVLNKHRRIIYTDIDTVWLSDPRPFFVGDSEMWFQLDKNYYCTGFFAMIASDATVQLLKDWDRELKQKNQLNQPLFNKLLKASKVKYQGLDTTKFPSGDLYFDKGQRKGVIIVHNNFIVGYENKVKRFKSVGLWYTQSDCFNSYLKTIDTSKSNKFVYGETVMMDRDSVKLLCSVLKPSQDVLEWGSGGSTLFYSKFVKSWNSIEHDLAWAKQVSQKKIPNVVYHSVPVEWDISKWCCSDGTYEEFKEYVEYPKSLNRKFDVVLVDGRARVACAYSVIRNNLLKPNGVVIIHDWEREYYKEVLKSFNIVAEDVSSVRHLGVLAPKNSVNESQP